MTQYKANFRGWQGMFFFAIALIAVFFIARAIFTLLYWAAPVLLIAAAIIDYTVIINYVKMIGKLVKRSPIMGIAAGALSVFFYPVVFLFLFGQAMLYRKVNKIQKEAKKQRDSEYIEYEEIKNDAPEFDLLEDFKKREEELFDKWELDEDDTPRNSRPDLW